MTLREWWQNGKDVLHIVGAKQIRVDETAAAVNWITWAQREVLCGAQTKKKAVLKSISTDRLIVTAAQPSDIL